MVNLIKRVCVTGLVFTAFFLSGCDNPVSKLKKSTMPNYNKTTIGKAFESVFDKPNWEAKESKKGEKFVEFSGAISKELHDSVLSSKDVKTFAVVEYIKNHNEDAAKIMGISMGDFNLIAQQQPDLLINGFIRSASAEKKKTIFDEILKVGDAVKFQWIFSVDGKSFDLAYVDPKAWDGLKVKVILDAIYK